MSRKLWRKTAPFERWSIKLFRKIIVEGPDEMSRKILRILRRKVAPFEQNRVEGPDKMSRGFRKNEAKKLCLSVKSIKLFRENDVGSPIRQKIPWRKIGKNGSVWAWKVSDYFVKAQQTKTCEKFGILAITGPERCPYENRGKNVSDLTKNLR